ncbi:MAG: type II toxin-antitoxin system mRNA interferase toxin, RelE/StbE family [Chlamydiia bacterium]|nr:type II toxin-antitoxin system mRNA interferase toxin, RelE/StbE family [Chlamydiia bacterium]
MSHDEVELSSTVEKKLKKVPKHIVIKLLAWVSDIAREGLKEVQTRPGFHDEPLQGKRSGQRSIRLSRSYRAIYLVAKMEHRNRIKVIEVNKHEY